MRRKRLQMTPHRGSLAREGARGGPLLADAPLLKSLRSPGSRRAW